MTLILNNILNSIIFNNLKDLLKWNLEVIKISNFKLLNFSF